MPNSSAFFLYSPGPWSWLNEDEYRSLEQSLRGALRADQLRRMSPKPAPVWRSDPMLLARMVRWIEIGARPSLHALASDQLRQVSSSVLPRAAELAGHFPLRSGPNCFGAVMAAAGEPVENEWVQLDEFQGWLDRHARPTSQWDNSTAGLVLVWREHGQLAHAAVTIGGGWVMQKQSQAWCSPVAVCPATEVIKSWRLPAVRLSRYDLI